MNTPAQLLTPRIIGEAENALRANLVKIVSSAELSYEHWVVFQVITKNSRALSRDDLIAHVSAATKDTPESTRRIVNELLAKEMVTDAGGIYELTDTGRSTFDRLVSRVNEVTRQMFEGLSEDDLSVAGRVLASVARKANALLGDS